MGNVELVADRKTEEVYAVAMYNVDVVIVVDSTGQLKLLPADYVYSLGTYCSSLDEFLEGRND